MIAREKGEVLIRLYCCHFHAMIINLTNCSIQKNKKQILNKP